MCACTDHSQKKGGNKINILFVAPRIPYPLDTGAKLRTCNLLKNISRNHRVTLVAFGWGRQDTSHIEYLERFAEKVIIVPRREYGRLKFILKILESFFSSVPFIISKYSSKAMRAAIHSLLKEGHYNIMHVDHLHMAQYLKDSDGKGAAVLDEHNVESIIWRRYYELEKNIFKKIFIGNQIKKIELYEKNTCSRFDMCLTVSGSDRQNLMQVSPDSTVKVIENGVDIDYFTPIRVDVEKNSIVFTGSMDWLLNEDAIIYFIKDVFPLLKASIPDTKLYIVGQNPSVRIKKRANGHRIIVTGRVDDVRPYIARSTVYIAPLRGGGGTRLKILEAMAMGKPVVSTAVGCEGIDVTPGENIVVADDPKAFSREIIKLFHNPSLCKKLGENGRKLVEDTYSWKTISSRLEETYQRITGKK